MEPRDYLDLLRRRWRSIVATALAVLAVTALVTFLTPQKFTATTQLFFGVQGGETISDLAQGSSFTEDQMDSYARVAVSPLVLNAVIKELALDTTPESLAEQVTATVPMNTVILEISATERDPDQAVRVANEVGKQLTAVVGDLLPQRAGDPRTVSAKVFAAALRPTAPSSPRAGLNFAVGLLLALVISIGIALLRHLFSPHVRNEQDLRGVTDRPVLAVLPVDEMARSGTPSPGQEASGAYSDAVERLRHHLKQRRAADRLTSILVTSSVAEEGTSTTVTNLAASMAAAGLRVIVVEADLRSPSGDTDMATGPGMTSVLQGEATLAQAVHSSAFPGVDVLAAGPVSTHKSELLESEAAAGLVRHLSSTYDLVLIDGPPLLEATDALALSAHVDATLLVVGADRIKRPELRRALGFLAVAQARLLGLVLNKVDRLDISSVASDDVSIPAWNPPAPEQGLRQQPPAPAPAVTPGVESFPWRPAGS